MGDGRCRNDRPDIPLFDLRIDEEDLARGREALEARWLTGPADRRVRGDFAEHIGVRHARRALELHRRAAPRLPRAGRRPGRRGDRAVLHFVATADAAGYCGASRCSPTSSASHDLGIDADHVAALSRRARRRSARALRRLPGGLDELAELCTEHRIGSSRTPRTRPAQSSGGGRRHLAHRLLQLLLQQGPVRGRGRADRDRR